MDAPDHERNIAAVHAGLGEEALDRAWEEGRAMTLADAVALVLEEDAHEAGG
jgi:hypothetical protein